MCAPPPSRGLAVVAVLVALAVFWAPTVDASGVTVASSGLGVPPDSILHDPGFVRDVDDVLAAVYDLDFERAQPVLERIELRHPEHPATPLLEGLPIWWGILVDPEDRSRDERLKDLLKESLRRSETRLEKDERDHDGRFFAATVHAFRARLRALRGQWIRAAYDGKRALGLVREVAAEHPDNHDLLFGLGLYDYFAVVAPDRYPVLRPLAKVFPEGDREGGLRKLRQAVDSGHFSRSEAAYFLLLVSYHFEVDFEASREVAIWLHDRHPHNPIFHLYRGRVEARWGHCEQAVPILEEIVRRHEEGRVGYSALQAGPALYLQGRCDVRNGRYEEALDRFRRFDRLDRRPEALVAQVRVERSRAHEALEPRGR